MSSFNDYGSRHIFPIWFAIGFIIVHSERIWIVAVLLHLLAAFQHHQLHYASYDVWKHHLTQFSSARKLSLSEIPNCARVAESDVFKQTPTLSHFNLYSKDEYNRLHENFWLYSLVLRIRTMEMDISGCFRSCNSRINEMYNSTIIGILEQEEQSCVLYEVYR